LFGYLNRAIATYASGYVGREELDDAVRLGVGFPMGPLTLLDLIGNDTALEVLETIYAQTRDPLHAPVPLLRQLVALGRLGRKTGAGFYTYERPGSGVVVDARASVSATGSGAASAPAVVGIAGGATLAAHHAGLYAVHGLEVVRGGGDDLASLTKADVVIEVLEADTDTQLAFVADLVAALPVGTPVLVGGPRADLTALAAASGRPADVVGFHVLEPTRGGRLVEIVTTVATSPEALAVAQALAAACELTAVTVGDRAGYLIGSLLFPYVNDAIRMVESGYATVDDVDHAMTLGCGYPIGPIFTADVLGLDRVLEMQQRIYDDEREPGLAPSRLLRALVTSGRLGRTTGVGFRELSGGPAA
jgi:3-hydroxybutyryl-CoA dehydrogenase